RDLVPLQTFTFFLRERDGDRSAERGGVHSGDVVRRIGGRRLLRRLGLSEGRCGDDCEEERPPHSRLRYFNAISRAKVRASSALTSPVKTASRVRSSAFATCGPTSTSRSLPRSGS